MRTMIDLRGGGERASLQIIDTATSVDCGREVRFRRSFRSIVECMVPACCGFPPPSTNTLSGSSDTDSSLNSGGSTVTCTFFGHRKGRVSFCIQDDIRRPPLLLLEFAIPTSYLAREMQHGVLRITLECNRHQQHKVEGGGVLLYDVPVWCMYCNGRKVGYAMKRQTTAVDGGVLKLMRSVSVGAGVIPDEEGGGELMYLRASFDRVIGSADSESLHMINPAGSSGQELSVFLLRS